MYLSSLLLCSIRIDGQLGGGCLHQWPPTARSSVSYKVGHLSSFAGLLFTNHPLSLPGFPYSLPFLPISPLFPLGPPFPPLPTIQLLQFHPRRDLDFAMASSSTKVFPDPVVLPPTMFFSGKENSGPCAHPRSPQHEDSVFKSTLANGVSNSGPTATPTSPSPSPPTSRRPSSSSSSYLDLKRRLKAQEAVVTHIKLHARTNKGGQQDVLRVQRNQLPKLPRRLPRVPTLFIPRENILAVDVSLEMVPADYILYKLESTYIR